MNYDNNDLFRLLDNAPSERIASIYERHGIDRGAGAQKLIDEIRLDGSNTFANLLRWGEGVNFKEIVFDVAEKFGVETNENDTVVEIERRILVSMIQKHLKDATPSERKEIKKILKEMGDKYDDFDDLFFKGVLTGAALTLLINKIGARIVAEVVKRIVMQYAAKRMAAEAAKRAAGVAGYAIPLLNIVMVGWTVLDIAGPAFRKTVPTVIEIALLRMEFCK